MAIVEGHHFESLVTFDAPNVRPFSMLRTTKVMPGGPTHGIFNSVQSCCYTNHSNFNGLAAKHHNRPTPLSI